MSDADQLTIMFLALEATGNGLVITNPKAFDNPIIHANQTFVDRCGFPLEQIIGKNCRFLQQGDRRQDSIKEVKSAILEGRTIQTTFRNYRKDGSVFLTELSIAPVHDSRNQLMSFVGVQYDAGAREQAERRVDECYSVLSHELRTPITSISTALNLLNEGAAGKIAPFALKLLKRAEGDCIKLTHLVHEILDWENNDALHHLREAKCSIAEVLEFAERELSQLAHYTEVELKIDVPKDANLLVTKGRLRKAIISLVTVAIRSSPADGQVLIKAERISNSETRVIISHDLADSEGHRPQADDTLVRGLNSAEQGFIESGYELDLALSRALLELHDSKLNVSQANSNQRCYWFDLTGRQA